MKINYVVLKAYEAHKRITIEGMTEVESQRRVCRHVVASKQVSAMLLKKKVGPNVFGDISWSDNPNEDLPVLGHLTLGDTENGMISSW